MSVQENFFQDAPDIVFQFPESGITPNVGSTLNGEPVINMNTEQVTPLINDAVTSALSPSNDDGEKVLDNSGQLPEVKQTLDVQPNEQEDGKSIVSGEDVHNTAIPLVAILIILFAIFFTIKS